MITPEEFTAVLQALLENADAMLKPGWEPPDLKPGEETIGTVMERATMRSAQVKRQN